MFLDRRMEASFQYSYSRNLICMLLLLLLAWLAELGVALYGFIQTLTPEPPDFWLLPFYVGLAVTVGGLGICIGVVELLLRRRLPRVQRASGGSQVSGNSCNPCVVDETFAPVDVKSSSIAFQPLVEPDDASSCCSKDFHSALPGGGSEAGDRWRRRAAFVRELMAAGVLLNVRQREKPREQKDRRRE